MTTVVTSRPPCAIAENTAADSGPSSSPHSRITEANDCARPLPHQQAPRNEGIDVVRLFAAAGIVFVHASEAPIFDAWGNLFRFGVPFFLFASIYYQTLSMRRKPNIRLSAYVTGRLGRLYMPFLAWSFLYLIVRDVKRTTLLHLPMVALRPSLLWKGSEYHLWFLPFLLGVSVVLATVHKWLLDKHPRWRWPLVATAIVAGCVAIAAGFPRGAGDTFEDPSYVYVQWRLALPAVCFAAAFAWSVVLGPVIYGVSAVVGWIGIALTTLCSLRQALHGIELLPRALSGLGGIVAAISPWRGRAVPPLARLGRMGYGIYLCHVLPVECIKVITSRAHVEPTVWLDVCNFSLSFAGSIAMVMVLQKSKKLAWLNG